MKLASTLCLVACVAPVGTNEDNAAITDNTATAASQFQLDRAVKTPACTATRIDARFALTAAHCVGAGMGTDIGSTVMFYGAGPGFSSANAQITGIRLRPGVDPTGCLADLSDCMDSSGNFAEIALLSLSAENEDDLEGPHATLAWAYPGAGATGKVVGAGDHNNDTNNPTGILRQSTDETASSNDDGAMFKTSEGQTDPGDSGGPFYVNNRVLGVLSGEGQVGADTFGLYTSVPKHLHWILTSIGYSWRGQPSQANTWYSGTVIQSFVGTELVCQYACEKTPSCQAYNHQSGAVNSCGLYTNVTNANTQSGWRGALKHGARTGNSGDVVGYVRSDGVNVVVHGASDSRIHELFLASNGTWGANDIHGTAPTITGRISGFRRADGINSVIYRSSGGHIQSLELQSSGWQTFDLTAVTNAEPAAGAPVAYVRADGVSAIVYRGATTNHLIELRLGSRGWLAADLSYASGSNIVVSGDPMPYVRSDGQNSIVFRSGEHIWEIFQTASGQNWDWGVPSQLAAAPPAASRPYPYTHKNGTNAIVYRSTTNAVIELYLVGSQWHWGQIGSGAQNDPVAHVRTDGVDAVVFRNTVGDIIELTSAGTPWQAWNLSHGTGVTVPANVPSVYHRRDGYNVVLFESSGHVNELAYRRGSTWSAGDLTNASGETP
jgi:hypothetical protein